MLVAIIYASVSLLIFIFLVLIALARKAIKKYSTMQANKQKASETQ